MSQPPDPRPPRDTSSDGWRVLSYLIGGIVVYGGGGWLLDHWLHTSFFLPVGIVLGAGLTLLMLHFRYGRS